MTNAEKFKEVFGFNLNTLYEEQDYDNDFEEKTFCNQITCVHCPFQFTSACVYHEPKTFWQSEYKEPKEIHLIPIGDKPSDTKTITISKSAVKHGNKDYVVYKRDWLMEHLESEFEVLKGARELGKKIKNAKPSTWLTDGLTQEEVKETVDNALVEVNNAKWKKAIEKIKAEIEAKNTSIEDFADTHGWVNGLTNEHNAHEADLAIIDKHTKELM